MNYIFNSLTDLKSATGLVAGDQVTLVRNKRYYNYDVVTGSFADIVYRTSTISQYQTNYQVETPGILYADDGYIIRLQIAGLYAVMEVEPHNVYFNFDMYDYDTGNQTRKNTAFSALFNVILTAFPGTKVTVELNPNLGEQLLYLPLAHNIGGDIFDWFTPDITFKIGNGTYLKADNIRNRYRCRFDVGCFQQIFSSVFRPDASSFTFEPLNDKIYPQWFGARFDYDAGTKAEIQMRFTSGCTASGNLVFDFGEVPYIENRLLPDGTTYDNYDYNLLTTEQRKIVVSVPVTEGDTRDVVMRKTRMALWRHPKLSFFLNIHYIGQGTSSQAVNNYPYIILKTTGNRTGQPVSVDVGITGVVIDSVIKQGAEPSTVYTDDYPAIQSLFTVLDRTYSSGGSGRIFHVAFISESGKSCALSNIVLVKGNNLMLEFFTDVYSVKTNMTGEVLDAGGYMTGTPEEGYQQGIGIFNFLNASLNRLEPFGRIVLKGHNVTFDANMDKNIIHYAHYEAGGNVPQDINRFGSSCVKMSYVNGAEVSGIKFVNSLQHCLVLYAVKDIGVDRCQFWNAATQNGINIGGHQYRNWDFFGNGTWNVNLNSDYSKSAGWRNSIRITDSDAYYCADFGFGEFLGSDVYIDNCRAYYCGNFRQSSQFGKGGGFGCESSSSSSIQHKSIFSNIKAVECICRGIHIDGSAVEVVNAEFDTIYSQYTPEDFYYDSASSSYKLVDINVSPPPDLAPFKAYKVSASLEDDRMFRECAVVLMGTDHISLSNITIRDCAGYGIGIDKRNSPNLLENITISNVRIINCAAEAVVLRRPSEVRIENLTVNGVNLRQINAWDVVLPIDYGMYAINFKSYGTVANPSEVRLYLDGIWLIGDNPDTAALLYINKDITIFKGVFSLPAGISVLEKGPSGTNAVIKEIYMQRTDNKDIEITDATKGLILRSPDGSRWRLTVDNSGHVVFTGL